MIHLRSQLDVERQVNSTDRELSTELEFLLPGFFYAVERYKYNFISIAKKFRNRK